MNELEPRKPAKPPPVESDLSQVMKHAPALCTAFGKFLATVIVLFAIAKTRNGYVGIATTISVIGGIVYHSILK